MSIIDGHSVENWSQRLREARQQGSTTQTRALLAAFAKIDDAVFREEMIILLEVIASNPKMLARMRTATSILTAPAANVIQFNPAG
jgi:hypothetical protein